VQNAFTAIFEGKPDPNNRDEETEAIVAVVARISKLVPLEIVRRNPGVVGRLLHYAFGCGFAVAYAAVRARRPNVGMAMGLPFGIALWFLSDAVLIPATHLGRPAWRYSPAQRANAVVSHIGYAATVEAVMRVMQEDDAAVPPGRRAG
jgi:uncharacterized membrane protein YagU involved in acid resistance